MYNLRKTNETGRSMVEMLGVLAIVGVLSVGGVYGYGVAMKKHKANELLHQASMLASSIAAQIASGKTDLALENFGNSSNGSFSSVKGPDGSTDYQSGDDKFTMQITGMDEAVCKQMQGMKGGMVRSVSCSAPDANGKVTATLAFNKDLSSTPAASDFDGKQDECEASGHKYCLDSNSCVASDKECPCNPSDIVKVYNCETKTTTDCCSTTQECKQPVCSCSSDTDCLGDQECLDGTCGCPEDSLRNTFGTVSKTDPTVCCMDGAAWDDGEFGVYRFVNIQACGRCPGEGTESTTIKGKCCSSDGYAFYEEGPGYAIQDIKSCGCPYDYNGNKEGEVSSKKSDICCSNGFIYNYDSDSYNIFNIADCGQCPYSELQGGSGSVSTTDPNVCCYQGWALGEPPDDFVSGDNVIYSSVNLPACGCPETGQAPVNGVCCNGYLSLECDICDEYGSCTSCMATGNCEEIEIGDYCGYRGANPKVCGGCPTDEAGNTGTPTSDGSLCCFNGNSWYDHGYKLEDSRCP